MGQGRAGSRCYAHGTFSERRAVGHKLLKSVMEGRLERCAGFHVQGQERVNSMLSILGCQCEVFMGFLLKRMSVEGPYLISVMVLSKGSPETDSNKGLKEVKLRRGREITSTTATVRNSSTQTRSRGGTGARQIRCLAFG